MLTGRDPHRPARSTCSTKRTQSTVRSKTFPLPSNTRRQHNISEPSLALLIGMRLSSPQPISTDIVSLTSVLDRPRASQRGKVRSRRCPSPVTNLIRTIPRICGAWRSTYETSRRQPIPFHPQHETRSRASRRFADLDFVLVMGTVLEWLIDC